MKRRQESSSTRKVDRAQAIKVTDADFKRLMVLGRGAYAKVVLVEDKRTKLRYAMKILNKNHIVQKQQSEHTMTERHILSSTSTHPFVCNLKFAFRTDTTLNLVMEYCPGGELFYHLSREGSFDETRARFIAAELTLALGHLHANSVVYRDLKPENILIDADGHIKLADFGLSKEGILNVASGAHTFCGTPEYLAPEVLLRKGHGTAVDWWSMGSLLFEMLTGLPPWYSTNRKEIYHGITHGALVFPDRVCSPLARNIITLLLDKNPETRLGSRGGVMEVKVHPFFADIDWTALLEKKYQAPWIPPRNDAEGSCFDTTYTQQPVLNSVVTGSQLALAQSQIPDFAGFSWYAPTNMNSYVATSSVNRAYPTGSPPALSSNGTAMATTSGTASPAPFLEEGLVQVRDRFDDRDNDLLSARSGTGSYEQETPYPGASNNNRIAVSSGSYNVPGLPPSGESDGLLFDIEMEG